jgi:hypothetical protein
MLAGLESLYSWCVVTWENVRHTRVRKVVGHRFLSSMRAYSALGTSSFLCMPRQRIVNLGRFVPSLVPGTLGAYTTCIHGLRQESAIYLSIIALWNMHSWSRTERESNLSIIGVWNIFCSQNNLTINYLACLVW